MSGPENNGLIPSASSTSSNRAVAESRPGTVVAKRYRIEELINFGGMGALYRARDLEAQRPCALRVLPDTYSRDPEIMNRFMREARAATEIGHPNIIEVFDIGRLEDGSVYAVMELLDGQTVAEILKIEGVLKPERAVHVAAQVCRALGTAHESSITHRDLKPENIVLIFHDGDLDFVKVVDFGICKHTDDGATTSSGQIIGAPDYMAPEQAAGAEANEASDIYALGCVLFEMLTGRVPYRGRNAIDVLMKKGASDAPRVTELQRALPEALADVVAWCLSRRPEDRPESMRALELDLMRSIDPHASQSVRARLAEASARTPASPINTALVEAAISVPTPVESPIARAVRSATSSAGGPAAEPGPGPSPAEASGETDARPSPPTEPESAPRPVVEDLDELDGSTSGGTLITILLLGAVATGLVLYLVKPELFGLAQGPAETGGPSKIAVSASASAGAAPAADSESSSEADSGAETGSAAESAGGSSGGGSEPPETGPKADGDLDALVAKADLAIVENHWHEPKGKSLFDYLDKISAIDPANEHIARLKADAAKAMLPAGDKALEEERWHDAVETYRSLLELDPDKQKSVAKSYTKALLQEGRLLRGLKNFEAMLGHADTVLTLNKKSYDAQLLRGEALGELNRWPEAVDAFKAASKLRPSSRDAKKALAEARKKAKG